MRAEVDARAARQRRAHPRAAPPGWTCAPGCYHQLAELGVARVGADPRCTVEDRDLYSHRRERPHRPPGRDHLARPADRGPV